MIDFVRYFDVVAIQKVRLRRTGLNRGLEIPRIGRVLYKRHNVNVARVPCFLRLNVF
jgi:hypothetical protein